MVVLSLTSRLLRKELSDTLMLVLLTMLVSAITSSFYLASYDTVAQFKQYLSTASGKTDIVVRKADYSLFDESLASTIKSVPHVVECSPRLALDAEIVCNGTSIANGTLLGIRPGKDFELSSYDIVRKIFLEERPVNGAIVTKDVYAKLKAVNPSASAVSLKLRGTNATLSFYVLYPLTPEPLDLWYRNTIIVPLRSLQSLVGAEDLVNFLAVKVDSVDKIDSVVEELRSVVPDGYIVESPKVYMLDLMERDIAAFSYMISLLLYVLLSLVFVLLVNTVAHYLHEKKKQTYIYKVLCLTEKDFYKVHLLKLLALTALGGSAGYFVGLFVPLVFYAILSARYGIPLATHFDASLIWVQYPLMLLAMLATVLATTAASYAGLSLPKISLRRAERGGKAKLKLTTKLLKVNVSYLSLYLLLLSTVYVYAFSVSSVDHMLRVNSSFLVERYFGGSLIVLPLSSPSCELIDAIKSVEGVETLTVLSFSRAFISLGDELVAIPVLGVEPETFPKVISISLSESVVKDPFEELLSRNCSAIATEKLLEVLSSNGGQQVSVGDSLVLSTPSGGVSLEVLAIATDLSFHWIAISGNPLCLSVLVSRDFLLQHFQSSVDMIIVKVADGAHDDMSLRVAIERKVSELNQSVAVYTPTMLEEQISLALDVLNMYFSSTVAIAFTLLSLNLLLMQSYFVEKQKYNITVFRLLGLNRAYVFLSMLASYLAINGAALLVGFLFGFALYALVVATVSSPLFSSWVSPPVAAILQWYVALTVVVIVLGLALSIRGAYKEPLKERLVAGSYLARG